MIACKGEGESVVENSSHTDNSNFVRKNDKVGPTKADASLLELLINLRRCAVTYCDCESCIWDRNCRG